MNGVTLIVCCHNSVDKLPRTLKHINAQVVPPDIPWEVIIVDNASTDGTAVIAAQLISDALKSSVRIVSEDNLGLKHARIKGITEATYDIISFIDDDNWICDDWVKICYEVMSSHQTVGACGGSSEVAFDVEPPYWFEKYKDCFAVGDQCNASGYVPDSRGYLWGAGLTIRKAAWDQLYEKGFRFILTGRQGRRLTSGEDSELCFALRLAGWRLYYESRLKFKHFMPVNRLNWGYLRGLMRAYGASIVSHNFYKKKLKGEIVEVRILDLWGEFKRNVKLFFQENLYNELLQGIEGSSKTLSAETIIGLLQELLVWIRKSGHYKKQIHIMNKIARNNLQSGLCL